MYQLIRPLLFKMQAENAHRWTNSVLKNACQIPGFQSFLKSMYEFENQKLEKEVCGIKFKNPIGLAAGFDKDAKMIEEYANLGFGFIEIGTLTPKPQDGNPQPRLFRLPEDQAIINRMGFNNGGVDAAVERLKSLHKRDIVIGGNIGKNKITPNEEATQDYLICFHKLFDYVDYFVVNVSSPNTPDLRALQEKKPLSELLSTLQAQNVLKKSPKPIFLKIAPDLNTSQLDDILEIVFDTKIAGIIATNTTISRENLKTQKSVIEQIGAGGLSGKPVGKASTEVLKYLAKQSGGKFALIGVGGIFNADDAKAKMDAGASLVQVYSGLIYEGPGMVKKIKQGLLNL